MLISVVPPGDSTNKFIFELELVVATVVSILLGLILYWRGARAKRIEEAQLESAEPLRPPSVLR